MTDVKKIQITALIFSFIFLTPMIIIVYSVLIIIELSWAGILAPIIMFIFVLMQAIVSKGLIQLFMQKMFVADKKTKKVNECVVGVKMIKFNAWENIMYRIIEKLRREQDYTIIIAINIKRGLVEALSKAPPGVLALACFP